MTETVTIASMITEAGTNLTAALGVVWSLCTANPILTLFLGAGVVSLGFTFFRKAKKTVK